MLKVKDFLLCCAQKEGLFPEDFEDAFTSIPDIQARDTFRFAVADGATESSFSKEWAQLLVKKFNSLGFNIFEKDKLKILATEWEEKIDKSNLSWFNQDKLSLGSYASFIGLEIDLVSQVYNARAVGDCCIFLVRDGIIKYSFPIDSVDDFSSRPILIGTENGIPHDAIKQLSGDLLNEDIIIFATDALAAWIHRVKDIRPWDFFLDIASDSHRTKEKDLLWKNIKKIKEQYKKEFPNNHDYFSYLAFGKNPSTTDAERWELNNWIFTNFITQERAMGRLKNDDVTLCVIKFNI